MSGETRNACANRQLPSHFPKSGAVLWQNLAQQRTKPQYISSCNVEMSTEYKEHRYNYASAKFIKSAYTSHLWLNSTVHLIHLATAMLEKHCWQAKIILICQAIFSSVFFFFFFYMVIAHRYYRKLQNSANNFHLWLSNTVNTIHPSEMSSRTNTDDKAKTSP